MAKLINTRGFISLLIALSFIFAFISGVILYLSPQGRIAYWINWKFLWLTKTDWTNIHIIFCLIFVIAAFFHIYYNWNVLLNYIYSKAKKIMNLKRELAIICFLLIISFIGSLKPFPPFSFIIKFNEYLKTVWIKSPEYEPPYGHAELLSLEEFSKRRNIDLNQAIRVLNEKGVRIQSPKESIGLIAKNNNLSPLQVYEIIKPLEGKTSAVETKDLSMTTNGRNLQNKISKWTKDEIIREFEGRGIGKKTLKQICVENKIDINKAIAKLRNKGFEVNQEETLKQIADKNNTSPIEVFVEILIDENKS